MFWIFRPNRRFVIANFLPVFINRLSGRLELLALYGMPTLRVRASYVCLLLLLIFRLRRHSFCWELAFL